jgi:hypothetical protein
MPAAAIVEPTERSNPPEITTIVSPAAAIPMMAIARPMFAKFAVSKKYGDLIVKKTHSATKPSARLRPNASSLGLNRRPVSPRSSPAAADSCAIRPAPPRRRRS